MGIYYLWYLCEESLGHLFKKRWKFGQVVCFVAEVKKKKQIQHITAYYYCLRLKKMNRNFMAHLMFCFFLSFTTLKSEKKLKLYIFKPFTSSAKRVIWSGLSMWLWWFCKICHTSIMDHFGNLGSETPSEEVRGSSRMAKPSLVMTSDLSTVNNVSLNKVWRIFFYNQQGTCRNWTTCKFMFFCKVSFAQRL